MRKIAEEENQVNDLIGVADIYMDQLEQFRKFKIGKSQSAEPAVQPPVARNKSLANENPCSDFIQVSHSKGGKALEDSSQETKLSLSGPSKDLPK